MRFDEVLGVHGRQGMVAGAFEFAGVDEPGDAGQDHVLTSDVGGLENRTGEHEFP